MMKTAHIHIRFSADYPHRVVASAERALRFHCGYSYSDAPKVLERSDTILIHDTTTETMWDMYIKPTPEDMHTLAKQDDTQKARLVPSYSTTAEGGEG